MFYLQVVCKCYVVIIHSFWYWTKGKVHKNMWCYATYCIKPISICPAMELSLPHWSNEEIYLYVSLAAFPLAPFLFHCRFLDGSIRSSGVMIPSHLRQNIQKVYLLSDFSRRKLCRTQHAHTVFDMRQSSYWKAFGKLQILLIGYQKHFQRFFVIFRTCNCRFITHGLAHLN